MSKQDFPIRSVVKGISWRATGTVDTMLISFLVTHQLDLALKIGAVEVFTKLLLYYFHERVWQKIGWGQPKSDANWSVQKSDAPLRSLVKGLSWRATGTFDTIVISFLITHDFSKAFAIGAVEVFTKVALYYVHERLWQKIGWGRSSAGAAQAPNGGALTA